LRRFNSLWVIAGVAVIGLGVSLIAL